MLSELQQLLACRRERENRAAAALQQARHRLDQAKAQAAAMRTRLAEHHQDKKERQDKLYRRSLRARLSKHDVDGLNIELDLMGEQTNAFVRQVQEADAIVDQQAKAVEEAAANYRRHRKAGDRWGHLVDDVAEKERLRREHAEEFAIEDDLGDRQANNQAGIG